MVVRMLPSGLWCFERDLHHLCWIAIDIRKKHSGGPTIDASILTELVQLLAIPRVLQPIAACMGHTCAVQADGTLACFGDDDDGQCSPPEDLGSVMAVAVGFDHTCVVKADGTLVCFGRDNYGQCAPPRGPRPRDGCCGG